ncbi:FkbM family methyltransferase [Ferruginibacter sp.]|uniref:FkbM family methyltransferase n=1 Tax=Ferruginibacter sp. TaxID=1940288 RepID=UPI00265AC792|nr:FkbM family methyltransferase [Ferruginibacter sp.]
MQLFIDKRYIDEDCNFLHQNLKEEETFVDLGANIGTWSLMACQIVGPKGKVIGFEPHPLTYKFYSENIQLNKFEKIATAYNVALGDTTGMVKFSSIFDDMNKVVTDDSNSISVSQNLLDDFTADLKSIDLMKIDIEGYELMALKGAKETLLKTNKVYFESSEILQKPFNYTAGDLIQFFNNHHFQVFNPADLSKPLDENYQSAEHENLLAIRSSPVNHS